MPECAFCPSPAVTKGGEHLWSDWINKILPPLKFKVLRIDEENKPHQFLRRSLDMKTPVVCERCNNGWMSDLENKHAKPAMADLILSDKLISLSPDRLKSIANFAFKTAVVADHFSIPPRQPFFSTASRHAFAASLDIPRGVQIWIASFREGSHGMFRGMYHESPANTARHFELYTCTFGAGYLLFQVVGSRWLNEKHLLGPYPFVTQGQFWNKFSIPFWPSKGESILWPPRKQFNLRWASRYSHQWAETVPPLDWLKPDRTN
jgi:hypothetical protein